MKNTVQKNHLAPEYRNALKFLLALPVDSCVPSQKVITHDVSTQENIQVLENDFSSRNIPSGYEWRWNQAKSRKQVETSELKITFYKLTPRKSARFPSDKSAPKLKLWKFCVYPKDCTKTPFFVLWCEKGFTESYPYDVSIPSSYTPFTSYNSCFPSMPSIEIRDLEFLAPFMASDVASELWPSAYCM